MGSACGDSSPELLCDNPVSKKLIHVPFCFYPDPVGGTEIYVEALARTQQQQGDEVVIAAPGETDDAYCYNRLRIRRFAVSEHVVELRDLYGEGDESGARAFGRILDEERPEVVHLHAFTRGVSLRMVREAKRRHVPVVFSYHTPTVSCQRGTLMRWGSEVCDGVLDLHMCAQCTLHGHGLSRPASRTIGNMPIVLGTLLGRTGAAGGMWTALRMTELVKLRHALFRSFMNEVDHVVAVCEWAKDLLVRNDVPFEKVSVSRQGLCQDWNDGVRPAQKSSVLRVAFLGRMDETKGAHLLIEALRRVPQVAIQFDVYGVVQGKPAAAYLERLERLAAGDSRVSFCDAIAATEVVSRLREYDLLAVPSQLLETGPLVVLEAFAAGIPVLGSNLGGIAELVRDGTNGVLVEHQSLDAWAQALRCLCGDRDLLARLRSGIRPPRRMGAVAQEMLEVYSMVLRGRVRCRKQEFQPVDLHTTSY